LNVGVDQQMNKAIEVLTKLDNSPRLPARKLSEN